MTTLLTGMAIFMTQNFLEKHMNGTRVEVFIHRQTFLFIVATVPHHFGDFFPDIFNEL